MDIELPERLPLVDEATLRAHKAFEPNDTRFRACARLLQSMWRERHELAMGAFVAPGGRRKKQGNLLNGLAAAAGANFIAAEIHKLVRRELAYREPGAMIDEQRLYGNLLSSMPLAWNFFGVLKLDRALAERFVEAICPELAGRVAHIQFEHSPARGDPNFTDDGTAFDAFISIRREDGTKAFLAFEVKYSETMTEPEARHRERYDTLTHESGLFLDPDDETLRRNPSQQLWREHLLAQAIVQNGLYDEGRFILLAPKLNNNVQRAALTYARALAPVTRGQVAFINLTLEDAIETLGQTGAPGPAAAIEERYLDFTPVHALYQ
jgi:hypothetical protein